MNYFEYADQLVERLKLKKTETSSMYEQMSANIDHLDIFKTDLYLVQVKECHDIANLAELILKGLINGSISPLDPID